MNEEWERSELAPWNRNQSDELEERWRQENEQQEYFDVDEDLPDFDEEPDDEPEDLWPDEEDEPPYDEEYCEVCGGPCHYGSGDETP